MRLLTLSLLILGWIGFQARAADEPPKEWIDRDTGHRVVRLSGEPGSESLYFNINSFTPDGKKMVFTSPTGICAIDLATRKIDKVVEGQRLRVIMVGRKTGAVYYSQRGSVFSADLETKATRKIADLPPGSRVTAVNCDETLLAGTNTIMNEDQAKEEQARLDASNRMQTRRAKRGGAAQPDLADARAGNRPHGAACHQHRRDLDHRRGRQGAATIAAT